MPCEPIPLSEGATSLAPLAKLAQNFFDRTSPCCVLMLPLAPSGKEGVDGSFKKGRRTGQSAAPLMFFPINLGLTRLATN